MVNRGRVCGMKRIIKQKQKQILEHFNITKRIKSS